MHEILKSYYKFGKNCYIEGLRKVSDANTPTHARPATSAEVESVAEIRSLSVMGRSQKFGRSDPVCTAYCIKILDYMLINYTWHDNGIQHMRYSTLHLLLGCWKCMNKIINFLPKIISTDEVHTYQRNFKNQDTLLSKTCDLWGPEEK